MPKLRVLSSKELVAILLQLGFVQHSQNGSHIKFEIVTGSGKYSLIVPNHQEIRRGTTHSIYRQITKHIPENLIHHFFYTE